MNRKTPVALPRRFGEQSLTDDVHGGRQTVCGDCRRPQHSLLWVGRGARQDKKRREEMSRLFSVWACLLLACGISGKRVWSSMLIQPFAWMPCRRLERRLKRLQWRQRQRRWTLKPKQTGEVIGSTEMANLPLNAVPEGLESGIGKPERQKVLHGFLAQVVVDPIDL